MRLSSYRRGPGADVCSTLVADHSCWPTSPTIATHAANCRLTLTALSRCSMYPNVASICASETTLIPQTDGVEHPLLATPPPDAVVSPSLPVRVFLQTKV